MLGMLAHCFHTPGVVGSGSHELQKRLRCPQGHQRFPRTHHGVSQRKYDGARSETSEDVLLSSCWAGNRGLKRGLSAACGSRS